MGTKRVGLARIEVLIENLKRDLNLAGTTANYWRWVTGDYDGLSLETKAGWAKGGESGPAIIPGDVDGSLLIKAINYRGIEMPPADEGGKLKPEEIGILTKWVQNGAVDPRVAGQKIGGMSRADAKTWWSYQPIAEVEPVQSPQAIDQRINRRLQAHRLSAKTAASRRELIRRATYDLTGLPPTYSDVIAFEHNR